MLLSCLFFYSLLKTTQNVTWGMSRSAINWPAARAAPCTWTASGTRGSRSARHYLVRGHCCSQNRVNLLCSCLFMSRHSFALFVLAPLACLCLCRWTQMWLHPDWAISAAFNCVRGVNGISEGTMTRASAQGSDEPCRERWVQSWAVLQGFTVTCTLTLLLLLAGILP